MPDLDPDKIMAAHQQNEPTTFGSVTVWSDSCQACDFPWPCEPYELAREVKTLRRLAASAASAALDGTE